MKKSSYPETKIMRFLHKEGIKYEFQKKFQDCKHINHLLFDFYLPDFNICIEYDGVHHVKPVFEWNGRTISEKKAFLELQNIKVRDSIKNKFCKENNIRLIRVNYKNHMKIIEIIKNLTSN